jgi:hypothetical protein
MSSFSCYGDQRNKGFCVHCGGPPETKDHLPSKVLLDEPLPGNVDVSPACLKCNNDLAPDEEYLACLLDCIVAGEVDPDKVHRPKVAHILRTSLKLAARLQRARSMVGDQVMWQFEEDRVRHVVMKLARGHSAYELNDPHLEEPQIYSVRPFATMSREEIDEFEETPDTEEVQIGSWPDVGSRMMSRLLIVQGGDDPAGVFEEGGWLMVQEGRYRYRVDWDGGTRIRMVIGEYLACDVAWE